MDIKDHVQNILSQLGEAGMQNDIQETERILAGLLDDKTKMQLVFEIACEQTQTVYKELEQYWDIGTVEECRAAVEKQVAKKPSYEGDGYYKGELVYDTWICPCCEKHYELDYEEYDFCPNCGQKIDWEGGAE